MDKETLLTMIRATHAPIERAVAAHTDHDLLGDAPGMPGWTRKDVLAHIEWWHEHSSNVLAGLRTGVDPYPGGDEPFDIDALNGRILEESRGRSAADVRAGEARSFERLVAAVAAATDEELFGVAVQPWADEVAAETVQWDSNRHYPDHLPQLA